MTAPSPSVYSMDEVAERLHKSRRWLQDFARAKRIGRMAGRAMLFTAGDVEKLRLAILHSAMDGIGRQAQRRQGYVYFIGAGDFVKIGYTQSPVARAMKMLTDSPFQLELLHVEEGTFKQEKLFHRHFASIRVRGEWFHRTPELLDFIAQKKRVKEGGK